MRPFYHYAQGLQRRLSVGGVAGNVSRETFAVAKCEDVFGGILFLLRSISRITRGVLKQ